MLASRFRTARLAIALPLGAAAWIGGPSMAFADTATCRSDLIQASNANHGAFLNDSSHPRPKMVFATQDEQIALGALGRAQIDCLGQPLAVHADAAAAAGSIAAAMAADKANDPKTARAHETIADQQIRAASAATKTPAVLAL